MMNSYPNGTLKKMNMVQLVDSKCVKGELSIEQQTTGRALLHYESISRLDSGEIVHPNQDLGISCYSMMIILTSHMEM